MYSTYTIDAFTAKQKTKINHIGTPTYICCICIQICIFYTTRSVKVNGQKQVFTNPTLAAVYLCIYNPTLAAVYLCVYNPTLPAVYLCIYNPTLAAVYLCIYN